MFDLFPQRPDPFRFLFATPGPWFSWRIPRTCTSLQVYILGAGGAGGNGFSRAAGSAGGGGGGGGAGALGRVLIPRELIPGVEALWIQIGRGGIPGTGGTDTLVGIRQSTLAAFLIARALAGGNGGNGSGTAGGTAGTAGPQPASTNATLGLTGFNNNGTGLAGGGGGAQTGVAGTSVTWGTGVIAGPGSGGGGATTTDFAGGGFTGNEILPNQPGGLAGGGAGNPGFKTLLSGLIVSTGGSGGGSNNAGVGGRGGDAGGPGAGGGGGGAGVTGGAGGNGGPGAVLIVPIY